MSSYKKNNVNKTTLKKMFEYGTLMIQLEYEYINELNVFPVPDGDTGTNMKITTTNAFELINGNEYETLFELTKSFSRALLMNARGNSGVILSQIIKGFVSSIKETTEFLTVQDFKLAFINAKRIAYESVSNPVEGTILSVIRIVSEEIVTKDFNSPDELFKFALATAKKALELTPELLPQLKEVGLVDSGGYGLVKFIEGMKIAVCNENLPNNFAFSKKQDRESLLNHFDVEEGFGYCSEIILKLGSKIDPTELKKSKFDLNKFKTELLKFGDSLVLIQDEDIVKVHIHTKTPHLLLKLGQKYGEFLKIKIDNMTEQFYNRLSKTKGVEVLDDNKFVKNYAIEKLSNKIEIIHTASNHKIAKIFKDEYGFNNVLVSADGNPSIQDIIEQINKVASSKIILVTDDSNIVLAAQQSAVTVKDNIDVRIIPARNIVESLLVSLEFDVNMQLDALEKRMNKALKHAITGLSSISVKDVTYDHIKINKDDYIGIIDKRIVVASHDEFHTLSMLFDKLIQKVKNPDVAIIFKGKGTTDKVIDQIENYLSLKYDIVCDIKDSNQDIYRYIVGLQ